MRTIDQHDIDTYLNGTHAYAYRFLGAHLLRNEKGEVVSTQFTVYAPHAKEVRLIGSFNQYEGWKHVLTKINHQGFYRIEMPGNLEWETYKYEIHTHDGHLLYKADPFAFFSEVRPGTNSKVCRLDHYQWHDEKWHETKKKSYQEPVLIYEMHLGSWQRKYGQFKTYGKIAPDLIHYLKDYGYTHVEFLPVYEHPLDDSWGYQGTGYFAATSRYGSPHDFMYLIDQLHQAGIGVIMDFVVGHICRDAHGLSFFDGTPLYEYADAFHRENVVWGTNNLDFSKGITRSFMLSALTFWQEVFHIDGFRLDAVANLIYYLGDMNQGVNQDAIAFLKQASTHLFKTDDRFLLIAEDSTAYPKVTHPVDQGGLGFNYKWNMGFMNDVLSYFKTDPLFRKHHHNQMTFSMVYAYNEQFVLPFSHDEVVHMKGSLANKMPGDLWQKHAQWRLLLTFWMTHPGKKLLFMGQEFAGFYEWDVSRELPWEILADPVYQKQHAYFKALAWAYRDHPALFQYDHDPKGFQWSVVDDKNQSVFAFARYGDDETLIVVLNMTPNIHQTYDIGVPYSGSYQEILNSNNESYQGTGLTNPKTLITKRGERGPFKHYLQPLLGPFSALILKYKP